MLFISSIVSLPNYIVSTIKIFTSFIHEVSQIPNSAWQLADNNYLINEIVNVFNLFCSVTEMSTYDHLIGKKTVEINDLTCIYAYVIIIYHPLWRNACLLKSGFLEA